MTIKTSVTAVAKITRFTRTTQRIGLVRARSIRSLWPRWTAALWLAGLVASLALPLAGYAQPVNELYRSKGYGFIFEIEPETESPRDLKIYQSTESALLPYTVGVLTPESGVPQSARDLRFLCRYRSVSRDS